MKTSKDPLNATEAAIYANAFERELWKRLDNPNAYAAPWGRENTIENREKWEQQQAAAAVSRAMVTVEHFRECGVQIVLQYGENSDTYEMWRKAKRG